MLEDVRRATPALLLIFRGAILAISNFVAPCAHATQWYAAYFDSATIDTATEDLTESGVTYHPQDQGTYNAPLLFTQSVKNDDTGQYFDDKPCVVWQGTLVTGSWQKYVLEVRPGWSGNGYVAFWINGSKVAEFSGKVGYQPHSAGGLPDTLDTMRVKPACTGIVAILRS